MKSWFVAGCESGLPHFISDGFR